MRILLDECIDRRIAKEIEGHEVTTVPQAGWAGIKNGELLSQAQIQFDAFVTVDRNLAFNRMSRSSLKDLRPLLPKLLQTVPTALKGQVSRISL